MTAKREEISIASCTPHPSNDENAAAIIVSTAHFRRTPALVPSVQATALRSSLGVAPSGNCEVAAEPPVPYVVAQPRSCACNALVSNGRPDCEAPDSPPLTRASPLVAAASVNHTGVGNGLFDIRQRLHHATISPSSICAAREFLADHHARGTHRAVIQPAATSPVRYIRSPGQKRFGTSGWRSDRGVRDSPAPVECQEIEITRHTRRHR